MKTYTADPELTALLREAAEAGKPLHVQTDGDTYEIDVRRPSKEDIWKDYDPEAARNAWSQAFGVMRNVEAEAWTEEYRAAREQDTPGRPAWCRDFSDIGRDSDA